MTAPVAGCACLLIAATAFAALTGPISGWQKGTEPATVSMYEYVPATLAPNAPILVLLHYSGGSAAGVFAQAQTGGLVAAADQYGFLMVVPQTSASSWDSGTTPSLTHNGGGDSGAIVDQVKYAIAAHNANVNRVYVAGVSVGAMMAEALLAVYPDVFKAGSAFSGVPAGCWSVSNPQGLWSTPCAGGQVTHTAVEWGNMARGMYTGYTGFRPRVQLWHGVNDPTVSYKNQAEAINQWTNVLGMATTPTSSATVTIAGESYARQSWKDSCGYTVLDAWSESGGPHGTDAILNAQYVVPFLGLDSPGVVDPGVAACQTGTGGSGGTGGGGQRSGRWRRKRSGWQNQHRRQGGRSERRSERNGRRSERNGRRSERNGRQSERNGRQSERNGRRSGCGWRSERNARRGRSE